MRNWPFAKKDVRRSVEPVALDVQLDIGAIGVVDKLDGALGASDGEFALDFEVVAAGGFSAE